MNGRLYDPLLRRFLNADENIQDPNNTQNYNKYGYVMNNPLMYNDPSGEFIFTLLAIITGQWYLLPITIGADLGALSGLKLGQSLGVTGLKLVGYVLGGAIIGSHSAGLAMSIAAASIPFAATLSIMAGSFSSSIGMYFLSGGKTSISMSFGVASYNFSSGEFGYLGKKGNSFMENFGYGLGAIANINDILAGLKPSSVELRTENDPNYSKTVDSNGNPIPHKDLIGHSQLNENGKILIDWGPDQQLTNQFGTVKGTNSYEQGSLISTAKMQNGKFWQPIEIKGVNLDRITSFSQKLNKGGNYNMLYNSCVSQTSRALSMSGMINIGIHPYILQMQVYLRSIGVRPPIFSYYLNQNYKK